VTGGGGFIGSHLVERLVELGAQTRVLAHYNSNGRWGWLDASHVKHDIEVILGDVCDSDVVHRAASGADTVFHLAALIGIPYSYDAPYSYARTNIEGTLNVLQACLKQGVQRVVHTSTSEVYGTARAIPISETHPLQAQSPYSATKIGADKMAECFYASFQLPVTTVRPFNTFGPRQSARAVIPTIVTQALTRPEIRLGSLTPTRDLNFVTNTVDGFILAAESSDAIGKVINIGSGVEVSIGHLADKIVDLIGKEIPIICDKQRVRPQDSEVDRLCADNSLAKRMLAWQPRVSLEEGLVCTIEWLRKNLHIYRVGVYAV